MPVSKRQTLALALSGLAALALSPKAFASERWTNAWRGRSQRFRGRIVEVTGGQYPQLNARIAQSLTQIVGRQAGQIHVHIDRFSLEPRVRSRRARPVRQALGRRAGGRGCGRSTLFYEQREGTIEARYRLRYTVTGTRIRPSREKARGRTRVPFADAANGEIRSRCGRERLRQRALTQLTGFGPSVTRRPLHALRDPLAQDIARDIAADLRLDRRNRRFW